ncbi:hypothetical protein D3C71_1852000 [compost metagenome]
MSADNFQQDNRRFAGAWSFVPRLLKGNLTQHQPPPCLDAAAVLVPIYLSLLIRFVMVQQIPLLHRSSQQNPALCTRVVNGRNDDVWLPGQLLAVPHRRSPASGEHEGAASPPLPDPVGVSE